MFDDPSIRPSLLPFTFTRPVSGIRVGILTIAEKWAMALGTDISYLTEPYLSGRFASRFSTDNTLVNGALCPDEALVKRIKALMPDQALVYQGTLLAQRTNNRAPSTKDMECEEYPGPAVIISKPWHIFQHNGSQIRQDFALVTQGRESCPVPDPHTVVYNPTNVFIEAGAAMKAAVLNAENGPIYIGKDATLHEGALVKGAFALCEGGQVGMGAKVRGDSTVGPFSKVGGEVSNSVVFGYSNKGHDGFIGNSVIGEWCNLGADTNTSNLKNTYAHVKLWDYGQEGFVDSGQQFCGLMMGDHAKCGINTMFNTGTVVGVGANVFGAGFPRTFIPSFSWGGASGLATFRFDKMLEMAQKSMERRKVAFDDHEADILSHIFGHTERFRFWEKD